MGSYLNILGEAFSRFYKTLERYGYVKDVDVHRLLALSYIEELLSGSLNVLISDEEYDIIRRVLLCLTGSNCLIPYPAYLNLQEDSLIRPWLATKWLRYTESDVIRISEEGVQRATERDSLL